MARTGFTQQFLDMCLHSSTEGSVIATLVEISHSSWATPFRFSNQIKGVTSGGHFYEFRRMEIPLPGELTESIPSLTYSVDDADNAISLACFQADTNEPFVVTMRIVVKSDPNTMVIGPCEFIAPEDAHSGDMAVFSGNLDYGLNELFPAHAYTPSSHPGLVGGTG